MHPSFYNGFRPYKVRQNNAGFSLIELLTVVVIIAIIALFGFPTYQTYKNRVHVAEALIIASPLQTSVSGYYAKHKRFAKGKSDNFNAVYDVVDPNKITGTGVKSVAIVGKMGYSDSIDYSDGIRITFDADYLGLDPSENLMDLYMTDKDGKVDWICISTLKKALLPSDCGVGTIESIVDDKDAPPSSKPDPNKPGNSGSGNPNRPGF